jgi:hypothetical protein
LKLPSVDSREGDIALGGYTNPEIRETARERDGAVRA